MNRYGLAAAVTAGLAIGGGYLVTSAQYVPPNSSGNGRIVAQLSLTGEQLYTTTGTSSDIALSSSASVFRYTGAGAATFTGFAGGTTGRTVVGRNESSSNVTLPHNVTSTAANRLSLPTLVDWTCPPGGSWTQMYVAGSTNRWLVFPGRACQPQGPNTLGVFPALSMASGFYYLVPAGTASTSNSVANNTLRLAPVYIPHSISITRLGAEVTGAGDAGSKVRLGIYGDDGTGQPGSLVVDAGQIAGDSATVQELTVAVTIGPGWYWFGYAVQSAPGTVPTMRSRSNIGTTIIHGNTTIFSANQNNYGLIHNGVVSGALPSTFSFSGYSQMCPSLIIKT